jgi:hypothetical protein
VKKRLASDGRYWANINNTLEESRWLEFPFVNRLEEFYEAMARRNGLTLKVLGTMKSLGFRGAGVEKDNIMIELRHA